MSTPLPTPSATIGLVDAVTRSTMYGTTIKVRILDLLNWTKRSAAWMTKIWDPVKRIWLPVLAAAWLLAGVPYLAHELWNTLSDPDNNVFGHAHALLLVLAAWVGLPFLIWRTLIAHAQNRLNQETHRTEIFAKAVESLAATRLGAEGIYEPAVETRVGAILALERLSKHSQSDYGIVIETLSAYVIAQCGKPSRFEYDGPSPDAAYLTLQVMDQRLRDWYGALSEWIAEIRNDPPGHRPDVATALNVLIRRRHGRHWTGNLATEPQPNLAYANLQGLMMEHVPREFLHDEIGLSLASLEGAAINGYNIEDSQILRPRIVHERMQSRAASRSLAGTRMHGLTLKQAQFFPIFDGADLSFAHMQGAKCEGAYFRGTRLVYANFENAVLHNAKFGVATIANTTFDGADLSYAEFIGANTTETSFIGANLTKAQFYDASLAKAHFESALLADADFSGASGLNDEMLVNAFGTTETKLPDSVERPQTWTDKESAIDAWLNFKNSRR